MRAMRATASLALLVLFGGSALVVAAMAGDPTVADSPVVASDPAVVYGADGFSLDDSPEQAAIFPGNAMIVLGTVQAQEADRWSTPDRTARNRFIYSPVRVRVDQVVRGSQPLSSDLVVRAIGGEVGAESYVFEDAPPKSVFESGRQLLLFLTEPRDTGDGIVAGTPNMVYIVNGDGTVSTPDGEHKVTLARMLELISAGG